MHVRHRPAPDRAALAAALSHARLWDAIDKLAALNDLSVSRLAIEARMDPTSFNKSKRISEVGRPRWPSAETIARILVATGTALEDFVRLIDPASPAKPELTPIPVGLRPSGAMVASVPHPGQLPAGDAVPFPALGPERAFGFTVRGNAMLPVYRNDDLLVVAFPERLRKGDRILICLRDGDVIAREFRRETASGLTVTALTGGGEEESHAHPAIAWAARILWSGQDEGI